MGRVMPIKWAYGVTTVPSRAEDLFPRTLLSLQKAGFGEPHLFVDGDPGADGQWWTKRFGLNVTVRGGSPVRTFGHWMLSIGELYIRSPKATYYALFQDDFVTYLNLRQYLEKCQLPLKGYWNLYTNPSNTPAELRRNKYAAPVDHVKGWYPSNQAGRGAVALVFNHSTILDILSHKHIVEMPLTAGLRSYKAVDGAIVTALRKQGYTEYVHSPSLVLHTGHRSSMGNPRHHDGVGFLGEMTDALTLLPS